MLHVSKSTMAMWMLCAICIQLVVSQDTYDYIIGAGSAGSVLANRLTENPDNKVLLLEAGGDDSINPMRNIPLMSALGVGGAGFWNYSTVPQTNVFLDSPDRVDQLLAGKQLGGTSMVNFMIYSRGVSADYDNWEAGGAEGWGFNDVLPYFLKAEDMHIPELQNSEYHATGGPLSVSASPHQKLRKYLLDAAEELGLEVGDCNQPSLVGACRTQLTTLNGKRHSTYHAYLKPAKRRSNLSIIKDSFVKKVIIEGGVASGVEYEHKSITRTVRASREVIVSAGAIGSPKLLMLSGIGPRAHLEELGIPVKADLPVGENFQDHTSITINTCIDKPGLTITTADLVSPMTMLQYLFFRKGAYASFGGIDVQLKLIMDPQQDDQVTPDLHYFISGMTLPSANIIEKFGILWAEENNCPKESFVTSMFLLHPKSRGTVRLRSTDPSDTPLIDPNYLDHPDDITTLIKSIRYLTQTIVKTDSLQSIGAKIDMQSSVCTNHVTDSDAYWECFLHHFASSGAHLSSTCRMGSIDDPTTVVDNQLKVKGIDRLRVVDGSVMPNLISGNLNAPIIMIAEKASDLIQGKSL